MAYERKHIESVMEGEPESAQVRGGDVYLLPSSLTLITLFLLALCLNALGAFGLSSLQNTRGEGERLVAYQEALKSRVAALESSRTYMTEEFASISGSVEQLAQLYNYDLADPEGTALALSGAGGVGGPETSDDSRLSPSPDLFIPVGMAELPSEPKATGLTNFAEDFRAELSELKLKLGRVDSHISQVYESLDHIPSIRPVQSGYYSSPYGPRISPITGKDSFHHGLDIVADIGDQVVATADGVVRYAGVAGGMGRMVEIEHGNGIRTRYGHNSVLKVREGDKVRRGQVIARVGMTGNTTGPHCHYVVLKNLQYVDPKPYIHND